MNKTTLPPSIIELINQLSTYAPSQRQNIFSLLVAINNHLSIPLSENLETLANLLSSSSKTSNKKILQTVQHNTEQTIEMLNNILDHSTLALKQSSSTTTTTKEPATTSTQQYKELQNLPVLIASDDNSYQQLLCTQLEALQMRCTMVSLDEVLQILHNAKHENLSYQMIIVASKTFDHHIAYLGRTLKANTLLENVMPILATPQELPNFELDRAFISGFACVLNLAKPMTLPRQLATALRTWNAKQNFTRATNISAKNHILLVEDDPIAQKVTQRLLEELDYAVDTATDGHTALKVLSQHIYDLVLMDIGLPDISGLEVTAELRNREGDQRHTPVIALSIYDLAKDTDEDMKKYLDGYLIKPLTVERLEPILERWITKRNSQRDQHVLPI